MKKTMLLALLLVAAVAAPVQAKPPKPTPPNKCLKTHTVSYVVSGKVVLLY